jgi:hypothetical protein
MAASLGMLIALGALTAVPIALASPAAFDAPPMVLLSTAATDPIPSAQIAVANDTYQVFVGDEFFGVFVRHISTDSVVLSNGRVLRTPLRASAAWRRFDLARAAAPGR